MSKTEDRHLISDEHIEWMIERFPDANTQRVDKEVSWTQFTFELMQQMDMMCNEAHKILVQAEAQITARESDAENEGSSND